MSKLMITWHASMDDRTCPICRKLNGYTWVFETGKDVLTDALWHPEMGIVWSLAQGSNAHARGYLSGHRYKCRCRITHEFDLEDVLAKCVYLKELAQSYSEPYIPWKGGGLFAEG